MSRFSSWLTGRQENELFQVSSAPLSPANEFDSWDEFVSKSAPMSISASSEILNYPMQPFIPVQQQQQSQQQLQQQQIQAEFQLQLNQQIEDKHMKGQDADIASKARINSIVNDHIHETGSYFDTDSLFSNEFYSSTETSHSNSPVIKVEDQLDNCIPVLATPLSEKLEIIQKTKNFTPKTLESIFDTKDILKEQDHIDQYQCFNKRRQQSAALSDFTDSSSVTITNGNSIKLEDSQDYLCSTTTNSSAIDRSNSQTKKRAPRKRLTDSQKQAHNKIEKKYRININAKIAGLQKIIPWLASESTAFETGKGNSQDQGSHKLNKSMILEKAIEYVLHLQEEHKKVELERDELKRSLQLLQNN